MRHLGLLGLTTWTASALEPLPVHIDLVPEFDGTTWSWGLQTDSGVEDPSEVFMPLRDLPAGNPTNPGGDRFLRPSGPQWDYFGTPAGEPIWFITQADNGYTWLGTENLQTGTFGNYVNSDFRTGGATVGSLGWIKLALHGVEGPGEFALSQFQGASNVVWMATVNGITTDDLYFLASGSHDHVNWAFSKKGVYRVTLAASAFTGPADTNPTPVSDPVNLYFAVGARASWRATHFTAAEVMDELVAGDLADADFDGVGNLLEYAFGSDPRDASDLNVDAGLPAGPEWLMVEDGGKTYPALRFFRRVNVDADVIYAAEWSSNLSDDWASGGVEHFVESVGSDWQRVTIRDTQEATGSRFARVRITLPQ